MPENSRWLPVFLLLGCLATSSCGDSRPPSFVSGPRVSPNPNPAVPLAAILECSTDEPSRIVLIVSDGEQEREIAVGQVLQPSTDYPFWDSLLIRLTLSQFVPSTLQGIGLRPRTHWNTRRPPCPMIFPHSRSR